MSSRRSKPTKGKKSGKAKQNGKEKLGKAQKSKKGSKSTLPRNQLPLILSMQALPPR
jgi:hypothetical protein